MARVCSLPQFFLSAAMNQGIASFSREFVLVKLKRYR
jgi:hypothetical protein